MPLSEYEKERIKAMYYPSDRIINRARELLAEEGIFTTRVTIANYWREEGFEINKRGGNNSGRGRFLSEEEINLIMNAYNRYKGSPSLAVKSLPYNITTIRKKWKEGIASGRIKVSDLEKIVE